VDESNKYRINSVYYIAALLIITPTSYLDILRELRDKHCNLDKRRELKFKYMKKIQVKNLFHDIVPHDPRISIHVEKGTVQKPLNLLYNILNNISEKRYERILVIDTNFLTGKNDEDSLRNDRFKVIIEKSHKVPALQIADIIAGSLRLFHEESKELLNIILTRICEYSRKNLNTPSVR
jgi:hypothetical protein